MKTKQYQIKPVAIKTKTQIQHRQAKLVHYKDSGKPAIKIMFPYNKDDVNHIKTLSGRRLHNNGPRDKFWTCPLSIESIKSLQAWAFELDEGLQEFLSKSKIHADNVEAIDVPRLKMDLYPFQKKGVGFIEAKNGRALIADEMGLGKTAQALAWLQLHPEKRPAIVIVPASLKLNWARESRMWLVDPNVQRLSGTKPNEPIIGDIIIINYDILPAWLGKLQAIKAQVLIIDECHYIKNNKAKRTKAVKALGKKIPHIIALSGTPIVNRPVEAYNALKLIDDTVIPNFWEYARRYCAARHTGFGWDCSGASRTEELHEKLTNTVMIRRRKEDVLTDLPDKTYSIVPIEINNRREYHKAESDFIDWIRQNKGEEAAKKASNAEALAKIEALKQLAVKGKMSNALEWIRDFLEVDGKLIVFATHKMTIDILMDEFKDVAVKIDGSTSQQARQDAVDKFQTDDSCRLFIGNIKAAGVGITLTAASNVAFLELPWTPGELEQATDRCHRIGQKNAVNVYYLLAQETIEETIAYILDKKRKVLDKVLDGKEPEESTTFNELLKTYTS